MTDPSQLKQDLGRFGAMRDRETIDSELPLLPPVCHEYGAPMDELMDETGQLTGR